jgi:hypothetical protein
VEHAEVSETPVSSLLEQCLPYLPLKCHMNNAIAFKNGFRFPQYAVRHLRGLQPQASLAVQLVWQTGVRATCDGLRQR